MARLLRVEFPGAIYHVMVRGNARQNIFCDDRDRERFLGRLAESIEAYNIRLYLFCLMTSHVHLVIETPDTNLSRFMQSVETGYTVYFNLRHGRVGHLMQGRYGAKLVEGEDYLLRLSRYVHLNPVFTVAARKLPLQERIKRLRNYQWSSYRSYIGRAKSLEFVDYGPVLAEMWGKRAQRVRRYREFVECGLAETDEEFAETLKESRCSIGSDAFRVWVDELYMELLEKCGKPEDVEFRKQTSKLSWEEILRILSECLNVEFGDFRRRQRGTVARSIAAKMLCKYGGLTNREAANVLKLGSGAAVGWQIRKLNGILPTDRKLRKLVQGIQTKLDQEVNQSDGV